MIIDKLIDYGTTLISTSHSNTDKTLRKVNLDSWKYRCLIYLKKYVPDKEIINNVNSYLSALTYSGNDWENINYVLEILSSIKECNMSSEKNIEEIFDILIHEGDKLLETSKITNVRTGDYGQNPDTLEEYPISEPLTIVDYSKAMQWTYDVKEFFNSYSQNSNTIEKFDSFFNRLYDTFQTNEIIEGLALLRGIKKYGSLQKKNTSIVNNHSLTTKPLTNNVFIVHGHDDSFKYEVKNFIESTLQLKAIILHEQVNQGKTIIEKLEEYTNVRYGIVLYSPCDKGCKEGEEDNLKPRARQNVVLEHGFLMGKLGRSRVGAIVKSSDVEIPNDYSGIVYMQYEGQWQMELYKELKAAGYNVSL